MDSDGMDRQSAFTGTRAASGAFAIDAARLESWLRANMPGWQGPCDIHQFKGGQSNPTYLVTTPKRAVVLRRRPPGALLTSAHAIDREWRVLCALNGQGFPVAEPIVWCNDSDVIGSVFYVMAHVPGRVIWDPAMPQSPPIERAAVYDAMNGTLARLHGFDPDEIGLTGFGRPAGYVARQITRWSAQYAQSRTDDLPDMDRLGAWLAAQTPPPARTALVHGDFRLDNLILAQDGPDIRAVLDWELATLGDPAADFAYHLMTWIMPRSSTGAGTGSLVGCDLPALGIPDRYAFAAQYARRTGNDVTEHLDFYLAYNLFRLAAILQGVVSRAISGNAANERALAMRSEIGPLAAAGLDFARLAAAAGRGAPP